MKIVYTGIILFYCFFIPGTFSFAQLRLPKVLGSNMVLQREKPVPVWGWASAGEKVTVQFAGQSVSAVTDKEGFWKVVLSPLQTASVPSEMNITASNSIVLKNILVGEVWLCSGQSNMESPMKISRGYAKPARGTDIAETDMARAYPNIRLFLVQKILSSPDVTTTGWTECSDTSLQKFSAAGFYFAKNIQAEINVPIGMISSSWGGSRIEPWTPAEAYKSLPAFSPDTQKQPFMIDSVIPGRNYRSMIAPLAPFALRGFLWYQGESNNMINDGMRFADKMQALVEGWRKQWGSNDLPFYSVQISPYYYTRRKDRLPHTPETLAEFWEAQYQSIKIPKTDMIVTTDLVDNLSDIHPSYKWEVGKRLALLALKNDYGKKIISSGPVYKKMKIKKDKAIISFANNKGLKSSDGKPLNWFSLAGADRKFLDATAKIKNNKVIVSSTGVAKPAVVRFAWNETAQPNFVNGAGLPAVPFRSNGLTWEYKK